MPEGALEGAQEEIAAAASLPALQELRVKYLGKKGLLTQKLKTLGGLSPEALEAAELERQLEVGFPKSALPYTVITRCRYPLE